MDEARRLRATEYFTARLAEEARRAERYVRHFAVIFVSCRRANPRDVFNNIRPQLRCTDIVEVIRGRQHKPSGDVYAAPVGGSKDGGPTPRDQVAVILPETDRAGAEVVVDRLRSHLMAMPDLRLGLSTYPEDSESPHDLLAKAAAAAGDTFRP